MLAKRSHMHGSRRFLLRLEQHFIYDYTIMFHNENNAVVLSHEPCFFSIHQNHRASHLAPARRAHVNSPCMNIMQDFKKKASELVEINSIFICVLSIVQERR